MFRQVFVGDLGIVCSFESSMMPMNPRTFVCHLLVVNWFKNGKPRDATLYHR